jgi:SAM-dependent methyltransferase
MLELGLGHGYSTDYFSRNFSPYRVLEGSPEMIARFRTRFRSEGVEIVQGYFENYDTSERFDNIGMGFILEHVDDPGLILRRYRDFLTPGGSVFVAVPNSESLHRRFGRAAGLLGDLEQLSEADASFGHKRYFSLASLSRPGRGVWISRRASGRHFPEADHDGPDHGPESVACGAAGDAGSRHRLPRAMQWVVDQGAAPALRPDRLSMAPTNDFGLSFDHFGLATRNSASAVAFLRGLGYQIGATMFDPLQNVNLILCESTQMPAVEVIFPAEQSGPLDTILKDRSEALYHLCYRSADLTASLAAMKKSGHRVLQVAPPEAGDPVRSSPSELLLCEDVRFDRDHRNLTRSMSDTIPMQTPASETANDNLSALFAAVSRMESEGDLLQRAGFRAHRLPSQYHDRGHRGLSEVSPLCERNSPGNRFRRIRHDDSGHPFRRRPCCQVRSRFDRPDADAGRARCRIRQLRDGGPTAFAKSSRASSRCSKAGRRQPSP